MSFVLMALFFKYLSLSLFRFLISFLLKGLSVISFHAISSFRQDSSVFYSETEEFLVQRLNSDVII